MNSSESFRRRVTDTTILGFYIGAKDPNSEPQALVVNNPIHCAISHSGRIPYQIAGCVESLLEGAGLGI